MTRLGELMLEPGGEMDVSDMRRTLSFLSARATCLHAGCQTSEPKRDRSQPNLHSIIWMKFTSAKTLFRCMHYLKHYLDVCVCVPMFLAHQINIRLDYCFVALLSLINLYANNSTVSSGCNMKKWLILMTIFAKFINTGKSFYTLWFLCKMMSLWIEFVFTLTALIDSRAAKNFIDQDTVNELQIPTQYLQHPLTASPIDGWAYLC